MTAITSAMILTGSATAWFAYHWLSGGLTTSAALDTVRRHAPAHLDNSVNLLLIGLDSRKDMNGNDLPKQFVEGELHAGSSDIGGYNTNTLILMHIPPDGGKVTAFSIPRDDYVQTFDGDGTPAGMHKIKEAYGLAKAAAENRLKAQGVTDNAALEQRSREVGREATLATVQQFLGVPIDHFAEVNLLGFYDIAKVLRPIQVCLKEPVNDRYSGARFPAGLQSVDARQALAFVRQRHGLPEGDLDRTHRQQAFLASVTHKLKTDGVFSDLGRMQDLFAVVQKDVVIDNSWDVLDFARQAPNLTGGNVVFHTLPIAGFGTRNGESVNLVNPVRIRSLVRVMIGRDASHQGAGGEPGAGAGQAPGRVAPAVVDVRNGGGIPGAAAAESRALAALGYTAGDVANALYPAGTTTVVYGPGAQEAAAQIAARLGVPRPLRGRTVRPGHVLVIIGAGFTPQYGANGSAVPSPGATPWPVPSGSFAGESVRMGGIPCVN
ncbi:LCP family protein [Streptomyces sp. RB6PN25]|uniref:LCP family protein n=1 Tax=Streptomyces humicola TaxID=2953240 RepID=A0ABT1Q4Q3_9ACTN|nr:LCP family protein [Streptomyces humicola]MCQ4084896.1 LCP family protein [Streptomyces humicola]